MDMLLGIDAGTTSVKAGLFSPEGCCLAVARQEYQLVTPAPEQAELDAQVYWQACVQTVRAVLRQADVHPEQIPALAVSSQGETLLCVDREGLPIHPALVWMDNRAASQAQHLAEQFAAEVYGRTGIPEIVPTWSGCKIAWIRENEPDVFARTAKFLLVQDYLIQRLTGQYATDGSIACTTLYYDLQRGAWWQDVLDALGITPARLPDILPPGSKVARLSADAASQLGLSVGTWVVNGGMDQSVGAIGCGNIMPGMVSETTGAALAIQATILDPGIDPQQVVPVYQHSVPGAYLFVPVCPTAGMAYKWFRDVFAQAEIEEAARQSKDSYDLLNQLACGIPAGAEGLLMLPHLMGAFSPTPNPLARGSFTGFTLSHTRAHFVRALLEGVAFMLRRNLEQLGRAGIPMQEIRSTGGGSRSPLWNQVKASVCRLPLVTLQNEETGLLGDAILAGCAAGLFSSIEDGCSKMVAVKDRTLPGDDMQIYEQVYQRYCALDAALDTYFRTQVKSNS